MRIQVLSDLHLEMSPCFIPVVGDVVVLAGDIHVGVQGITWAKVHCAGKPVIYTAGNHEYYGGVFPNLLADLKAESAGSNVTFLENGTKVVGAVRFLGATLWTDFTLNGYSRQQSNMATAQQAINDFCGWIKKPSGAPLCPTDVAVIHQESMAWLRSRLAEKHEGPTVVVCHHAVHPMSTAPMFRYNSLAPAFTNNLENVIRDFEPDLVVTGHTHYCVDYHIGRTRMVSNQRGYSDQDSTGGFRADLVVTL